MIAIIVSGITCAIFVGAFLVAYLKSKGVYDEYIEGVDKKEYSFKDFLPLGFWLNELNLTRRFVPAGLYVHIHKYNMKISQSIIELNGARYGQYYIMLHNANRTAIGIAIAAVVLIESPLCAVFSQLVSRNSPSFIIRPTCCNVLTSMSRSLPL